jgi:NAD(P)-dependent dehydrogenase (short-subunit alcohol dehydrogenase family)
VAANVDYPIAMTGLLRDRVAVITGAGSGIGRAIAQAMAAAGAVVVALDLNESAARETADSIGAKAYFRACDVTDRGACDAAAAQLRSAHGRVDILVNNAGIVRRGTVRDAEARSTWDTVLAANLDGAYNMCTAFVEPLIEARGAIINIASIQAFVAGSNLTAYSVSKGGIRNLTFSLAAELSPQGVRVNAIAPGFTDTPMTQGMRNDPAHAARFGARVPLGRPALPIDIAMPAVFLASDMARYITGVTLPVDGGYLCY